MPANTNPIFVGVPQDWAVELDNADGTSLVTLMTAGDDGSLLEGMSACSDDTSAVELDLYLNDGASDFYLGSASIPAGAGTDGGTTPAVNVWNQTDFPWIQDEMTRRLGSGSLIKVAAHTAITAAKVVHIAAWGGDY